MGAALRGTNVPPQRLSILLSTYPVRKTSDAMGSTDDPFGGWHHQWVRTYATRLPIARLRARLEKDVQALGLVRSGSEWRTRNGAFRLQVLTKNPNFWLPDDLKATAYLRIWEPRPASLSERIDDAWVSMSDRIPKPIRPRFVPIPVRVVSATAPETR